MLRQYSTTMCFILLKPITKAWAWNMCVDSNDSWRFLNACNRARKMYVLAKRKKEQSIIKNYGFSLSLSLNFHPSPLLFWTFCVFSISLYWSPTYFGLSPFLPLVLVCAFLYRLQSVQPTKRGNKQPLIPWIWVMGR